jgi:phytoene dehydrogenase-like protein
MSADVLVLGAGVNGLTAAALLARRGRSVVVVERRAVAGGLAAGEEFAPGYRHVGLLHEAGEYRPALIRELELEKHGLRAGAAPEDVFAPQRVGSGLRLAHDPARAEEEIGRYSRRDAARYRAYRDFLGRLRPLAERLLAEVPPDPGRRDPAALARLAGDGWALRRLGADTMMDVLRLGPMCVADWLREWFETELLGALLAGPAVRFGFTGPWSPATNALLVRHEMLMGAAPEGGPAALARALESAARAAGAQLRLGAEARRIRVAGGQVLGVTLSDGEEIDAAAVLATCDPRTVFTSLLPPEVVGPRLRQRMEAWRAKGMTAKVHLAVSRPLRFACRPDLAVTRAFTGETLDGLERQFDFAKYRRCSERPVLDILVPTETDPSLAPAGGHVVSVLAHWTPRDLEGGWTDAARDRLGTAVLAALGEVAPDLPGSVVEIEVLTPADLEERYGLSGGHPLHGEHGLDQLLVRPAPECAGYGTPIGGLFLGGSGSWPGGGLTGRPGALAAAALAGAGAGRTRASAS